MKVYSDLHIHSRFSRACSKSLNISNLERYARMKGLNLLGTGDFTHPLWLKELKAELKGDGSGVFKTKTGFPFMLTTELSNIYTQDGHGRRVHNVILAPSFEVVDQINSRLLRYGRLDYDGRPMFGFSCIELMDIMRSVSPDIEVIPAHIWTPWFSLLGSQSGFDSVEECFGDRAGHIHALETGLSSNPSMNWRLSRLDRYNLVSFSDSHSHWPWRMGREVTVFELGRLAYQNVLEAIRTRETGKHPDKEPKGLVMTIEVNPEYGKYHFDGHRSCGVSLKPSESRKLGGYCPRCGRPLTIGVLNRVEELADRPEGVKPANARPFLSILPLSEMLSFGLGIDQLYSKKVWAEYDKLVKAFGSELNVLLDASLEELKKHTHEKIAELVVKCREGKVKIDPGYDGVYGKPVFEDGAEKAKETGQKPGKGQTRLGDFQTAGGD
jgi:uncharacterized protein (TIGR00375 family)